MPLVEVPDPAPGREVLFVSTTIEMGWLAEASDEAIEIVGEDLAHVARKQMRDRRDALTKETADASTR